MSLTRTRGARLVTLLSSGPQYVPGPRAWLTSVVTDVSQLSAPTIQLMRIRRDGLRPTTSRAGPDTQSLHRTADSRATKYRPPSDLLANLRADLAELEQVIRNCQSAASLRRLVRVAAQLSGMMCLLMVKLDDRDGSRRWGRTARTAAGEAGDPAVMSWVLAQEAYGRYYSGDLDEAVDIARHAQALMPPRVPCIGAVLAAALEARAHAARGNAVENRNALDRAEKGLATLDTNSVQISALGYTESQFRFHEENAYTRLGLTRPAWRAQDRALEVCPTDDYTDWALIRLDRAVC